MDMSGEVSIGQSAGCKASTYADRKLKRQKRDGKEKIIPEYSEADIDKQISPASSDHPHAYGRYCRVSWSVDGNSLSRMQQVLTEDRDEDDEKRGDRVGASHGMYV